MFPVGVTRLDLERAELFKKQTYQLPLLIHTLSHKLAYTTHNFRLCSITIYSLFRAVSLLLSYPRAPERGVYACMWRLGSIKSQACSGRCSLSAHTLIFIFQSKKNVTLLFRLNATLLWAIFFFGFISWSAADLRRICTRSNEERIKHQTRGRHQTKIKI